LSSVSVLRCLVRPSPGAPRVPYTTLFRSDGDGRRDLVGSIPDALASTANFLKRSNWQTRRPWGYEVKLPEGFNASLAGRTNRRPDRKSTRLNSSHVKSSYAVFCVKKKNDQ